MKSPVNMKFLDPYEGEAVPILTCGKGTAGIALSLANNGGTEVFMPIADAEEFAQELERSGSQGSSPKEIPGIQKRDPDRPEESSRGV